MTTIAYRAARVFDGWSEAVRPTLLVEDGRVVEVGADIPESVEVVDVNGATLLPGLIDCHQHLCFTGQGTLEDQVRTIDDAGLRARCRAAAQRALAAGVTTIRDLGDRGWVTLPLRGDPTLPTIVASGPPITVAQGHCWYLGGECDPEPNNLRAAIDERVEHGSDVVKIMVTGGALTPTFPTWQSQFTGHQLQVLVDHAHHHGLPVAAHCHGIDGIRDALAAGVDSIEHCTFVGADERPVHDEQLLRAVAASEIAISLGVGRTPGTPAPPRLAAIGGEVRAIQRRLRELGASIVPGTDAGVSAGKPHDVLQYALVDYRELGFTPPQALRSMTADAAVTCGLGGSKGRLAAGYDADFIAVSTDPLGGDTVLDVTSVWRAGHKV